MFRQVKQAFSTPKFLIGFIIFTSVFLLAIIYPLISPFTPLQLVSRQSFTAPGRYVNIQDVVENRDRRYFLLNVEENRVADVLSVEDSLRMIDFLETHLDFPPGVLSVEDEPALIAAWNANYDPNQRIQGMTLAAHNENVRFNERLQVAISEEGVILAYFNEDGELVQDTANMFESRDFVNVNSIVNLVHLPLGTDNFGRDVLTQLLSAVMTSLRLGLIAGAVATTIGLSFGLISGYTGGFVDDAILFITNLFTVIPGFVLLILISNAMDPGARSVNTVAIVIGFTAWPWTCRSVRSQVLSLRNRDHVNLSKLSGHSMPRIILNDILPYVASYVVMALILQISTAILAEAQLSMLGLGPSTTDVATLGLMMNWAQMFSAWQAGAWWAFVPIILAIAAIAFSMNLMNTGLDQVFNPQLREG
ncbi:MAG: ABC transporter permease [Firmicutes bacterium]|nr:ABC transporter permease [Bacillota bacterium]